MFEWFEANWGSIIVVFILAVIVISIIIGQIRAKKKGYNLCGYRCGKNCGGSLGSDCSSCGGCSKAYADNNHSK